MKFDYSKQVDKGVALLDSIYPGWKEKIDLDRLEMAISDRCILGQLYGDFYKIKIINPEEYGFSCYLTKNHCYFDLTDEWKSRFKNKYDLSKHQVEPGKYVIDKLLSSPMQEQFVVGKTIEVINFIGPYFVDNKKVKNMVIVDNTLFSDCTILVTPL
jgi:hypothetical protein